MLDAGFEAVLGTVLLFGNAFAQIDHSDFPDPATDLVLAIFALGLIALAIGLAWLVKNDVLGDRVLQALAATNAGFAVLLVIWVLVASGFNGTGRTVVWITVVVLLGLAAAQARLAR
jgi:hypothetical protein